MTTVAKPQYRKRVGYQAALLGGFATLAAALLIVGNDATHQAIADRQAEDLLASLAQVIPAALHDNDLRANAVLVDGDDGQPLTIYRAVKGQRFTAFAWRTIAQGYAGGIDLLLGVDASGQLLGVRVLAHAETPGLGDRIEAQKSDWILGFNGRSLDDTTEAQWHVKKDGGRFDQFSGATITPRAVVRAVHDGLVFFRAHRDQLAAMQETKP